ncbi:PRELI domain-containing protein 1, mitochondrial-like isoform X1 [Amphibalanus amphitrite]|uniref:PRELI domain-containing protein 1, mitochondrial-like isoform X1 n=2 Tax=Amphibalanus amphitrite TaxID=1232801 RepID=UPI001C90A068|nr:PRELI domain-containing protein 1, mitochondrial-like isoform X1 [Amphibalanus amphitrite]
MVAGILRMQNTGAMVLSNRIMVRYCEQSATFNHPWDQVVQAFWERYPNPHSSHVLTEDTVARRLEGGCLRSKRIVTKTNRMPKWGERFLSARTVAVLEESACEPARHSMVTLTRNLAHTHLMEVTERVEYVPHPDDPQHKTLVRRCAWVGSRVFGFGYAIQAFGVERFKKNLNNTVLGFNHVLAKMFPQQNAGLPVTEAVSAMDARKERLRETAKKATELAKSKAGAMVPQAACAERESR